MAKRTNYTYSNQATSTVAEAINSTESLENFCKDLVKEVKEKYTDHNTRMITVASTIKNAVESMQPNTNNPIWEPLIKQQVAQYINFSELAEEFLECY